MGLSNQCEDDSDDNDDDDEVLRFSVTISCTSIKLILPVPHENPLVWALLSLSRGPWSLIPFLHLDPIRHLSSI